MSFILKLDSTQFSSFSTPDYECFAFHQFIVNDDKKSNFSVTYNTAGYFLSPIKNRANARRACAVRVP